MQDQKSISRFPWLVVLGVVLSLLIIGAAAYYGVMVGKRGAGGAPTGAVEITPLPTNPKNDPATLLIQNEGESVENSEVVVEPESFTEEAE